MRHPRFLSSLLPILGILAVLAIPVTATAGSAKKAPAAASKAAAKKKVDPARSAAAKKGWETRRINQKAEANWAARIQANPKANKPGAREAFIKRSVAAQRGWQKRTAAVSKTAGKKASAKAAKKTKKATKVSKKGKKVAQKTGKRGKQGKAAADGEEGIIANAGVGNENFQKALGKFQEAEDAKAEGREMDAAIAQMDGHDAMAQAAFDTADEYEAAGRTREAEKLNAFGEDHLAKADQLEAAIGQQQELAEQAAAAQRASRPSAIRRFFSRLNPFKKRGGGDEPAVVANP